MFPNSSYALRPSKRRKQQHAWNNQIKRDKFITAIRERTLKIPEVLAMIFFFLDISTLKKTRLVCKYWLGIAGIVLKKSSVVCLDVCGSRTKLLNKFLKIRKADYPMPTSSVCLAYDRKAKNIEAQKSITKLHSNIFISRLDSFGLPIHLSLEVIQTYMNTLVQLELHLHVSEKVQQNFPSIRPSSRWPSLQNLLVNGSEQGFDILKRYVKTISIIVNRSPVLISYKSVCKNSVLGSLLTRNVNLCNIKNLTLLGNPRFCINAVDVDFISKIRFNQLSNLKMGLNVTPFEKKNHLLCDSVLLSVIRQNVNSLRILDLSLTTTPEMLDHFPTCPTVEELSIPQFRVGAIPFLRRFPKLKRLNMFTLSCLALHEISKTETGFTSVECLKLCCHLLGDLPPILVIKLFILFPRLIYVTMDFSLLLHCCCLKASEPEKFKNVLNTVRHVVVHNRSLNHLGFSDVKCYPNFRYLTVLKGLETIALSAFLQVQHIPFQRMKSLVKITFPWGTSNWHLREVSKKVLSKLAKSDATKIVTNCCIIRRTRKRELVQIIQDFFASASNAICGCNVFRIENACQPLCLNC